MQRKRLYVFIAKSKKNIEWVTWVLPPYNNRFNLIQRGRHALCLRKGRAGTQRRPYLPVRPPLATASQVNRALYGLNIQFR
jgi:hypothetical protein